MYESDPRVPMPPPPADPWAFDIFFFFLVKFPRLISENPNAVFNTAISIIFFVYQFNVYVHHFFFSVYIATT